MQSGLDVVASLRRGTSLHRFEPLGGGLHVRFRIDPNRTGSSIDELAPACTDDSLYAGSTTAYSTAAQVRAGLSKQQPKSSRLPAPQAGSLSGSVDNGGPYVKVLVLYTSFAAQIVGSSIASQIQDQLNEANTAYASSGIQQTLVATSIQHIAFNEGTNETPASNSA